MKKLLKIGILSSIAAVSVFANSGDTYSENFGKVVMSGDFEFGSNEIEIGNSVEDLADLSYSF